MNKNQLQNYKPDWEGETKEGIKKRIYVILGKIKKFSCIKGTSFPNSNFIIRINDEDINISSDNKGNWFYDIHFEINKIEIFNDVLSIDLSEVEGDFCYLSNEEEIYLTLNGIYIIRK